MKIAERPSPNHDERRDGNRVELVVLHYTAMDDAEAAMSRLCDPECEVSAHYLVGRDGQVTRMIDEDRRAWHAGEGKWADRADVNSRSIGVELDNDGQSAYPDAQMEALEALLADILERNGLEPKHVIAHSDMAPDRKSDPGRRFDWKRLADKGLSVWPEASMPGDFMRYAAAFGYPVEHGQMTILDAFRQRFRPEATGPIGPADEALMAGLARHYPADITARIARRTTSRPITRPITRPID
ncbi:MAG: N-acetylmuramoyl-L-alanine amidase [Silicimonas sp.]|nr:N-acetylmuramoyl-L-alanine amidase [Silicimonas sp.]NNF92881.1 N-acetylmuramoyl-L-alanine amidase [Boseongicola sp.]RZW10733.1 MAG: N-acetylmuramoyl-L-alanine amidase [Paracoccaceae bacterium]MBT8423546.1 N-acetylmuramoyl-L-alanine amidase [Silicimonas sp.]NND19687.1 N-acetylmuramoyl-L-alanine amidase [Silicimonas sp.]